jgi:hypothetical protein
MPTNPLESPLLLNDPILNIYRYSPGPNFTDDPISPLPSNALQNDPEYKVFLKSSPVNGLQNDPIYKNIVSTPYFQALLNVFKSDSDFCDWTLTYKIDGTVKQKRLGLLRENCRDVVNLDQVLINNYLIKTLGKTLGKSLVKPITDLLGKSLVKPITDLLGKPVTDLFNSPLLLNDPILDIYRYVNVTGPQFSHKVNKDPGLQYRFQDDLKYKTVVDNPLVKLQLAILAMDTGYKIWTCNTKGPYDETCIKASTVVNLDQLAINNNLIKTLEKSFVQEKFTDTNLNLPTTFSGLPTTIYDSPLLLNDPILNIYRYLPGPYYTDDPISENLLPTDDFEILQNAPIFKNIISTEYFQALLNVLNYDMSYRDAAKEIIISGDNNLMNRISLWSTMWDIVVILDQQVINDYLRKTLKQIMDPNNTLNNFPNQSQDQDILATTIDPNPYYQNSQNNNNQISKYNNNSFSYLIPFVIIILILIFLFYYFPDNFVQLYILAIYKQYKNIDTIKLKN